MADLIALIENTVAMIPQISGFLVAICYVIGILLVISGLLAGQKRSESGPQSGGWGPVLVRFIMGICFLSFPTTVGAALMSVFGSATASPAEAIFSMAPSMTAPLQEGNGQRILTALVRVIQLVGLIGLARGLYLLNAAGNGSGQVRSVGPGITFVVGSTLAVNFPLFVGAIELLLRPAGGA
jgi:hypothetical protein